jgi:hypothetical protein
MAAERGARRQFVERTTRDRARDVLAGSLDVVDERDKLGAAFEPALLLDDEFRQRRAAVQHAHPP